MDKGDLVPGEFPVPVTLETDKYRLRKLTLDDAVKDYDAVMTSVDHLRGVFGPGDDWPRDLTLMEDMVDLGWHQKEFELGRSFAYTVMRLDESQCLGCVYIYPTPCSEFDAKVFCWVRASEVTSGLDRDLFDTVQAWIACSWPFENVAYPGRKIDFFDWQRMEACAV